MGHETVSSPTRLPTGSLSGLRKKNIIAGAVAAVLAGVVPVAHADIELGEGFTATGFLDMSFLSTNPDGGSTVDSAGIDQFETDFKFAGSNGVSAQVDIEYGENASDLNPGDTTFVEQAFVTKKFNDQFSVKVGRFLSYSGWETEEPTGLFQYSASGYAPAFYGYYQQGASAYYDGGKFALMGSVVNDAFGYAGGPTERDTDKLGYELGVALMPVEGLTTKLFYMSDDKTDRDVVNFWASYSVSGFTFAGEYNDGDYGANGKGDGYLLMANYAKGNFGVTARYVDYTIKDGAGVKTIDTSSYTFSPSYKVGSNLLIVGEVRFDKDNPAFGGNDSTAFALEALFTF
jgi:hypothetical protein